MNNMTCDICGKFGDSRRVGTFGERWHTMRLDDNAPEIDVCHECYDAITGFARQRSREEGEKNLKKFLGDVSCL